MLIAGGGAHQNNTRLWCTHGSGRIDLVQATAGFTSPTGWHAAL